MTGKKLRTGRRSLSHFELAAMHPGWQETIDGKTRQERRRQEFKLKKKYRKILNDK